MKRHILSILLALCALTCWGVPPNLACERIFHRQDIRTPGHKVVTNKNAENYFRSVTADCDPRLLADIKTLVARDQKRATEVVEGYKDGMEHIILNIPSNGHVISIGFWWKDSGYLHLFIQSEMDAFE